MTKSGSRAVGGPPGSRLRPDHKDGPQRVRSSGARWTDEAEAIFLDRLAASCNVAWAAEEAGFTCMTPYYHRRKDPAFAERWDAALDQGYARLELELVRTANDYLAGFDVDDGRPLRDMTVREAIAILGKHRARSAGKDGRHARFEARPRSLAEVRDSILAKIEAFDRAHGGRLLPLADGEEGAPTAET